MRAAQRVTFEDVRAAADRLRGVAHRTPIMSSASLNDLASASIFLKTENLQRMGAFKFRGAYNRIAQLDAGARARGVVAYSSGNHAQGVALASRIVGTKATIVMPEDAPRSKLDATRSYGADIVTYVRSEDDRAAIARGSYPVKLLRGMTGTAPQISVAVVSWNTRDLLDRCLRSVEPEVKARRSEVWVVDNGSTDGSVELVRERYPWTRLVVAGENLGFGKAINLVAERTRTPWIAAANADVALGAGSLERLLRTGSEYPRAGILAPRLVLEDGATQHSVYSFPTLPFTLFLNLGLTSVSDRLADRLMLMGHWDPERRRRVDWAVGAFLLIRRAAWAEVGGFDPDQWMYAEDLDLGWRMARAGWMTCYEPNAIVYHRSGAAAEQMWPDRRQEQWMRSTYAWMLRRRGIARTRAVALLNVAGAAVRAAAITPAAHAEPERWEARRRELWRWARLHAIGLTPRRRLAKHR